MNEDLTWYERLIGVAEGVQNDGLPKPTVELEFDLMNMAVIGLILFFAITLAILTAGKLLGVGN